MVALTEMADLVDGEVGEGTPGTEQDGPRHHRGLAGVESQLSRHVTVTRHLNITMWPNYLLPDGSDEKS